MVARAANNLIAFGHTNGIGEDVEMFTIDGGATLANETNPGEAMDFIVRVIEEKCTIIAVGAEDSAGAFRIMVQGSLWTPADLQTALQALGSTVGTNNYNASGATVSAFTIPLPIADFSKNKTMFSPNVSNTPAKPPAAPSPAPPTWSFNAFKISSCAFAC